MKIFRRAITSILRQSGKTIILLLLVFILGTTIAGAISVESAISNTHTNLRANMPAVVTTFFDFNTFNTTIDWNTVEDGALPPSWARERVTAEHVHLLSALDYVETYDYVIRDSFLAFDLQGYVPEALSWHQWEREFDRFIIFGGSNVDPVHIQNEMITLTQGRAFEEIELSMGTTPNRSVAIISEALANENNLSIGSTFILPRIINYPHTFDDYRLGDSLLEENIYAIIEMEFEIIGLFDLPDRITIPQNEDEINEIHNQKNRLNTIYVPSWSLEELNRQERVARLSVMDSVDFEVDSHLDQGIHESRDREVMPVFVLTDPMIFEDFRVVATDLLPPFYSVVDMSGSFSNIATSMETLQEIANWVLYASIGATLLILSLLITLFLRDRRYEIGIYLALGEKKGKIVFQILLEVMATALVGITLAVFTGSMISNVMSRSMLENELIAQQENQTDMIWFDPGAIAFQDIGIPRRNMTPEQMLEAFDVSLSIETVGIFYLIGLGAVTLSTMIPVIYVVKLKPKEVLTG